MSSLSLPVREPTHSGRLDGSDLTLGVLGGTRGLAEVQLLLSGGA